MNYTPRLLAKASLDLDHIYHWLAEHSPQGANEWYRALSKSVEGLRTDPERFGRAPDSRLGIPFRQRLFKTRRGKRYRLIFTIEGNQVYIFRIRGPGEPPLTPKDL
jgi:plasmid stabilization system protein ParE